jgi:hypothetical protein
MKGPRELFFFCRFAIPTQQTKHQGRSGSKIIIARWWIGGRHGSPTQRQKPIFLLVRRRNGFGRLLATQPKGGKVMQRGEQAFGRLSTPVSAEVVVYYKRKTQTPMQKPIFLLVRRRNGFGRLLATQPKGRKIRTGGVKEDTLTPKLKPIFLLVRRRNQKEERSKTEEGRLKEGRRRCQKDRTLTEKGELARQRRY